MAWFVVALFVTWLIATMVAQGWQTPWVAAWRQYDIAHLVPGWTFFAPNPGTADSELLYRDELVDGQLGPWTAIRFGPHTLMRVIWNPEKRHIKAVTDLTTTLVAEAAVAATRNEVFVQFPYIALLSYVSAQPAGPLTSRRQFVLAHSFGEGVRSPQIIFISGWHRL